MNRLRVTVWGTLIALCLMVTSASAQDQEEATPPPDQQQAQQQAPPPPPGQQQDDQQGPQQDPPNRVARLQYMTGSVSIQPHGTDDWVAGGINRPLTTSDNVWTDKDSRAELNVGTGVVRMSSETSLTLTNVGDTTAQFELHQGAVNLRVRHMFDGEVYEVDTPNMAFTVQRNGDYRFDVDPNGDASVVTVWDGEGDATGSGPAVHVKAHERVRFTQGNSMAHEVSPAPAPDGFDDWARVRDERADHSVSSRYVAPGTIGSEDLDAYGTWRNEEPYGNVWVPSGVGAGWAPYHYGHWVWISPWGWTWVDDEPWGFAPYHYGRWVYGSGYWGWAPGPYYYRPFYAPALVAWFGGPRWGVGLGFGFGFGGGIGWCPLGWGEPFLPWYHTSFGYYNHINIYNARFGNFGRFNGGFYGRGFGAGFRYSNLRSPGGAVAVSRDTMVNSRSVARNSVRVPASRFEGASLGSHVGVSPGRASMLGPNAGRASATAPSRSFSRSTVSHLAPPSGGARTEARGSAAVNAGGRPAATEGRFNGGASASGHYVPRPPQSSARGNSSAMTAHNNTSSVPRPSQSVQGRSSGSNPGSNPGAARSSQGYGQGRSGNYVPRPTGPVKPSPSTYAANSGGRSSQGYSAQSRGSYGNSSRSYGGYGSSGSRYGSEPSSRGYSAPSSRGYSAPSSRGYSAPSSRGYSAPSSRGYSAPSSRGSSPSYHASNGGGGGGGGHYSGGGGGHSGGGGGHSGGGHGR